MRFIFDQHPLSDTQLKHAVPSVFADQPYHGMSPRYGFIPTSQVVGAMRDGGWQPVHARQTSPRSPTPEYARHMMRFRREETKVDVGDGFAEIVLVNSHDGTSAYQMHAGFFRLVCANGLIVDDGSFARISIRHSGDVVGGEEVVRPIGGRGEQAMTRERLDFYCWHCRSRDVKRDAWVMWNDFAQAWGVSAMFDDGYCMDCDGPTKLNCVTRVVEQEATS